MTDYGHDILFGCFLTPDAGQSELVVELARLADGLGLDLLGVQDHPYQPGFLDMWTLLSALALETGHIRLVPDVANLPLRPPAVLARAAATLDILSGGRVELGLGSGAYPEGIRAMGGETGTPGVAVEALGEAIGVIRALWTLGGPVTIEGEHYAVRGAQPGPVPPHPIGIWLGSYKPRMLRLTGRLADGWIPTLGYASPEELGPMNEIIDSAARAAGRDPAAVRRVYNVSGRFGAVERGFLNGPPAVWAAQLTEMVLDLGISAFLLAPGEDAGNDLQRFAEEVAPAVREAVEAARRGAPRPATIPTPPPAALPSGVAPTTGAPASALLPEEDRPRAQAPPPGTETAQGIASAETLAAVHAHLRSELAEIYRIADAVARERLTPAQARSAINRMTMRQNFWTFGSFCAQYCRVVTVHHTIEDRYMFPALRRSDESLAAVLSRLHDEHEIIAAVLERIDVALVAMIERPEGVDGVRRVVQEFGDALLSHLAYEEQELLGPLARSIISV